MTIRKELAYNEYHDTIVGFSDFGNGQRSSEIAKEVTVFMVRSLCGDWKCVISYFASKNAIRGSDLKDLILQNIEIASSIGLNVRCVISDQGKNNICAFKELNVTPEKPYFHHIDKKVYVLYDPCHLIKSVRNSLMKNDLETCDGVASWGVVAALHNADKENVVKACPKLTDVHIAPNNFQKMSVRLATQVLSHSCSAAITAATALDTFPEKIKKNASATEASKTFKDLL